jgi:hypothetical protein
MADKAKYLYIITYNNPTTNMQDVCVKMTSWEETVNTILDNPYNMFNNEITKHGVDAVASHMTVYKAKDNPTKRDKVVAMQAINAMPNCNMLSKIL